MYRYTGAKVKETLELATHFNVRFIQGPEKAYSSPNNSLKS